MAGNPRPRRERHVARRSRCSARSTPTTARLDAERAGRAGPACRWPRRTGWSASWSPWGALARRRVGRVRRRAAAVGPRAARPGADRAAPASPRRSCTTSTAPPWPPCTSRSATATEVLYVDRLAGHALGAGGQPGRVAAAAARDRRGQGAAGARAGATCAAAVLGRPAPGSRRTRSPSRAGCGRSCAGCARDGYAHHRRGDEPRRLLGGRAGPRRGRARSSPRSASSCPSLRRDRARLVSALQVAARGIGRSLAGCSFR